MVGFFMQLQRYDLDLQLFAPGARGMCWGLRCEDQLCSVLIFLRDCWSAVGSCHGGAP